jgi:uncharacterized RDD family membrane protein YckC
MPCSVCGEICRCPSGPSVLDEREHSSGADATEWRHEIADRLHRYQARRKPRPPRYPSLRLQFEEEDLSGGSNSFSPQPSFTPQTTMISHHALAVSQHFATGHFRDAHPPQKPAAEGEPPRLFPDLGAEHGNDQASLGQTQNVGHNTGRIIEFPRSWTPAPAPRDELAEPVIDAPRILEAPEILPAPPALGGITIEPAALPETGKRPGIDVPLEGAHAARRVLGTTIDAFVIAAACVLFGFIFWKITAIRPPRLQIVGLVVGLGGVFWAVYQYLLIVYAGATPGLRLAGLRLARFDGTAANRRLRRWRVLASFLSAASLGMGYVWVFLDEDALCWHDRITHTYLASK